MLYQVVQSYFFLIVVADLKGLFTNKCMTYTNFTFVLLDFTTEKFNAIFRIMDTDPCVLKVPSVWEKVKKQRKKLLN